ncbi:unnamed protein product [Brassica rapa subsp. trilocularis]
MIRRTCIPLHRKAFALVSSSDRNFSYKEKLRSGLVDIKKDDAVALFQSRPLPTVVDFSRLFSGIARTKHIVINCFCRRRKLGFAFSVFGKMLKLGYEPTTVVPNLIILNTLVNGLCLQDRVSEAVALIDRMMENGCQPDQFTYGPVLNRMCKSGNTASAFDLLTKMEDRKIKPQVVIYNMIIDSLCKDESLDDALSLFSEMETKGMSLPTPLS